MFTTYLPEEARSILALTSPPSTLELPHHRIKLLLHDDDALSYLISTLREPIVILGLENLSDLPINSVDLDIHASTTATASTT